MEAVSLARRGLRFFLPAPTRSRIQEQLAHVGHIADRSGGRDVRVLTRTGPGGVGKTGLALEVAVEIGGSFANGYSFVYLAPISDPGLVMPAIVQTLGIGKAGTVQRLNA